MKKITKPLIVLLIFIAGTFQNSSAQSVEEGNFNITVQYGFPDLFKSVIKRAYNDANLYENLEIKGFGPASIRAEYMVADKIGIGVLFNYTTTTISYIENSTYIDTAGNIATSPYDYTLKLNRMRILPRFAFHFGNSDKFDGYFGVAAGYYNATLSFETNDPNVSDDDFNWSNLTPVGFRLDVGGNYYFTDNVGMNFEIGLGGGPLINAGIALKF